MIAVKVLSKTELCWSWLWWRWRWWWRLLTNCHQRVNHFPRSYELTRKDRWRDGLSKCRTYNFLNIRTYAGCTRTLSGYRSRRVRNISTLSRKPSWFPTSTPSLQPPTIGWEVSRIVFDPASSISDPADSIGNMNNAMKYFGQLDFFWLLY